VRYQLVMQEMTWYEARNHCEQLGGHLAIINSKEEADFVAGLTAGKNTWLGATDAHKEGDWRWLDGTELNFNNWDDGEPNNLNKEHVLQMGSSGKWNDTSDGGKYYFVCEWSGALKHHYALRKSAEEGDPEALRNFAFSLQRGEGIAPDVKAAIKWFRKGAERGDIKCATALGWKYFTGKVLKQDHRAAMKWFRMGANAGDGGAEFALGLYYSQGIGDVGQDHKEAVKWWRKSAERGVSNAEYALAGAYFNGRGVEKNLEQALLLYQKVADNKGDVWGKQDSKQKLPQVQYELGEASYVKDNYRKASEWYHKAAHQGYADAQFRLAQLYYRGKGIRKDHKKAVDLLRRAVAQGHQNAQDALDKINSKNNVKHPVVNVKKGKVVLIDGFHGEISHRRKQTFELLGWQVREHNARIDEQSLKGVSLYFVENGNLEMGKAVYHKDELDLLVDSFVRGRVAILVVGMTWNWQFNDKQNAEHLPANQIGERLGFECPYEWVSEAHLSATSPGPYDGNEEIAKISESGRTFNTIKRRGIAKGKFQELARSMPTKKTLVAEVLGSNTTAVILGHSEMLVNSFTARSTIKHIEHKMKIP